MYVLGIDPGPVTGIVRLELTRDSSDSPPKLANAEALQVTSGLLDAVLTALTHPRLAVAVERFVVGPRASRSSTPAGGHAARRTLALAEHWAMDYDLPYHTRSAADVKPWATDARLAAAGLLEPTKGMRHARDAARHALFTAVKTYGLPDPLSRRSDETHWGSGVAGIGLAEHKGTKANCSAPECGA